MRTTSRYSAIAFAMAFVASTSTARAGDQTDIVPGKGPTAVADREAIAAAIAMLPKRPVRIALMDVSQNRPDVRDHLLTLDGFTVKGNGVIYLVQQGRILEGARRGSTLCRAMLAGVIWHEMAHLDGADERSAQLAERSCGNSSFATASSTR